MHECANLRKLENGELYETIWARSEKKFTFETIVDRIEIMHQCALLPSAEIAFAASHFFRLSENSDFRKLNLERIAQFLLQPYLRLVNEDSFYHFIGSRISCDPKTVRFFEFVRFESLSITAITKSVNLSWIAFNSFTLLLWKRFAKSGLQSVVFDPINDRFVWDFSSDRELFDGTIPR
jgi:hypothetical protein